MDKVYRISVFFRKVFGLIYKLGGMSLEGSKAFNISMHLDLKKWARDKIFLIGQYRSGGIVGKRTFTREVKIMVHGG